MYIAKAYNEKTVTERDSNKVTRWEKVEQCSL